MKLDTFTPTRRTQAGLEHDEIGLMESIVWLYVNPLISIVQTSPIHLLACPGANRSR
jgi:hypothetical protein